MEKNTDEARVIKVLGDGVQRNWKIERYREFYCYGRKNVDEVCGACRLRFACLSTRDELEIPIKEFKRKSIESVTVQILADRISGLRYKYKRSKTIHYKTTEPRVQLNFNKVVRKNDM